MADVVVIEGVKENRFIQRAGNVVGSRVDGREKTTAQLEKN